MPSKPIRFPDSAKRIVRRMHELKVKGVDITKEIGADSSTITQWRNGQLSPNGKYLQGLSKVLKCDPDWLTDGKGIDPGKITNVSPGPDLVELVPLIGYTTAGDFQHVNELQADQIEKWFPTVKKLNGLGFALRVEGDSMTSPMGKSYPDGCIAIFDASNRSPNNGDLVLAKRSGTDEITFKKYVSEEGMTFLRPLNPTYPPMLEEFKVMAVFQHAILL